MEIGVLSATGAIGQCVVAEASSRRHRVTAFTRDPSRIPTCTGRVTWRVVEVTAEQLAAALVDVAETPRHVHRHFTAGI